MIDIHKARIFDLASGIGVSLDSATSMVKSRTLHIIKDAVTNFRKKFIDSVTPTIYIIDVEKDIVVPILSKYPKLDPKQLHTEISRSLESAAPKISVATFSKKVKDAEARANKRLSDIAEGASEFNRIEKIHDKYRRAIEELGREIGDIFENRRATLLVEDPENLGQPGKVVFIGKSFIAARNIVNEQVNTILRILTSNSKASYGSIMAAGHTSVKISDDVFRINTPALTEALFKLEAGGIGGREFQQNAENSYVRTVPIFIDNTITFNENFKHTASTLLDIGFSFVVPMDTEANSLSGSTHELQALKALLSGHVYPELVEAVKQRAAWLANNVENVRNSPNIIEFVEETIVNSLLGKNLKQYIDKSYKKSKTKLNIGVPVLPNISGLLKVKNTPGNSTPALRNLQGRFTSLTTLQVLLNTHLQDVLSANMGDGNRKDILNYRTGRFAASAKVERLTQSREGMITAFYSYMKNPYATFSEGGRQEYPRTRDPKLLISKSIREIAATNVGNKLRAVSV